MSPHRPLLVVFALLLAGCQTQIQHGLAERDANEILSALAARGLEAHKVAEPGKHPTWAIEVDEDRAIDALRLLTELKLPRPHRTTTQDLASQSELIETPATERLRQLEAEEGDIELALESLDGVASAAVEIVVPTPARPGQTPSPSKASVLLRVTPEALEHLQRERADLRALVAASVDGLVADDVVLHLDPVATVAPTPVVRPDRNLRALAIGLGAIASLLALGVVLLAWRLRTTRRPARAEPSPSRAPPAGPNPRPVVSPGVQRKVA